MSHAPAAQPPAIGRAQRWLRRLVVVTVLLGLLPVPWQHNHASSVGLAWRMDRRLVVDGQRMDPPGRYSWLTAGRPALVGELVWQRALRLVRPTAPSPVRDLRAGTAEQRPAAVEPVAAAVGMAAAGQPRDVVDAAVGGHGPPYSWIRSMAMGSSHGLMVGLTTYAALVEEDLAAGRHIAGTGTLAPDGTVGTIGGLPAKAAAARRAGADVLLVPAAQVDQLAGFDPGAMLVLSVESLDDAITQLRATR